jgi:xanthine dehydrogenase YagS FAD-binding subunit
LIVAVEIPIAPAQERSTYLKVRDRASYEFALVSVAAGIEFDGEKIASARLALGGVATIPWRVRGAEAALAGKRAGDAAFAEAAEAALEGALPRRDNAFKIELAKRAVVRALRTVVRER